MAHFYGTIRGGRGEASRLGHKSTGLRTVAASHAGACEVSLDVRGGIDWLQVRLMPWQGAGVHAVIYDGPLGEYKPGARG